MTPPLRVQGIRLRFNADGIAELNQADLAKSADLSHAGLAKQDLDHDGWVSSAEVMDQQGLAGSTYGAFEDLVNAAARLKFADVSPSGLRASGADAIARALQRAPAPKALATGDADLSHLARSMFEPLASHLAGVLAGGASYPSVYGTGPVYYADVSALFMDRSIHELNAALAVLAAREGGGVELGFARRRNRATLIVQGEPDRLELDSQKTGLDLLLHSHPRTSPAGARPSQGDFDSCRKYDPNHVAAVVSMDGWFSSYTTKGGDTATTPVRLWRAMPPPARPHNTRAASGR